ncbi:MAG: Tat pathway signal protein [Phenylobacterium sp.]|nr:Tat pathway signal protein [Phenylobacterium sp.]MBP7817773.1 Tat pathway signal protein [Phenylobacterium sp.]MBP9230406.1 Tat pathway signal protein [Phenylobacterium sp.]MBP9754711.1 Tat pathway signal protein [Phenylobacterium sp.]
MDRRHLMSLAALAAALPVAAKASGGGEKSEKKKGGGLSYLQLPTLTATIMRVDGRRGVLTVETGIDIPDTALRARAELLAPRFRAGFVQTLQIYASGLDPATPPNADFIARELQRETDRLLGRPGGRLLLGTILVN